MCAFQVGERKCVSYKELLEQREVLLAEDRKALDRVRQDVEMFNTDTKAEMDAQLAKVAGSHPALGE